MPLLPQFGFFEMIALAVVALVVVGPRDLPKLMRSLGKLGAQARRMAGEFRAAFDQMAREAELEEMRAEIDRLKADNPAAEVKAAVDDVARAARDAATGRNPEPPRAPAPTGEAAPPAEDPDAWRIDACDREADDRERAAAADETPDASGPGAVDDADPGAAAAGDPAPATGEDAGERPADEPGTPAKTGAAA